MNSYDFAGRTAVITGGARGIGLAVAERLRASGARVSLWDRDAARLAEIGWPDTIAVDLTDPDAVAAAAAKTVKDLGAIDALVAGAGITGPNTTTWEYPVDAWRQVIEVDLNAIFYTLKAVVPHMLARDYGRIVTIASIAGKDGNPNAPAYSAAKAGVIGLTKSIGKELAKTGVRANTVAPAAVRTEIFDQMSQTHIDFMLSKIPMGRFGTVEEIASLVVWLCSEECAFSTGAVFDATGGRAVY